MYILILGEGKWTTLCVLYWDTNVSDGFVIFFTSSFEWDSEMDGPQIKPFKEKGKKDHAQDLRGTLKSSRKKKEEKRKIYWP